jgi:hypothetical protein
MAKQKTITNRPRIVGRIAVACVLGVVLGGCGFSWFSDRKENPVIEDYVGGTLTGQERVGTLATTASHRTVLVKLNTEGGVGRSGEFCPEPPPDVARSISDSFAAALEAAVETPAEQAEGQGSLTVATTFSSAVAPLLRRSQGLQFYRDGMYYNCVAFLNRAIDEQEFRAHANKLREDAFELIKLDAERPDPTFFITVGPEDEDAARKIVERLKEVLEEMGIEAPEDGDGG